MAGKNVVGSTVTKADLVEAVFQKIGFSKKEAAELVEVVFSSLKTALVDEGKVKISGFGNFVVKAKKERRGRNPKTGNPLPIPAHNKLTFRPSQILRDSIQAGMLDQNWAQAQDDGDEGLDIEIEIDEESSEE